MFKPNGTQTASIKILNKYRNDMTHTKPIGMLYLLQGAAQVLMDCASFARFLALEANVILHDDRQKVEDAFNLLESKLKTLRSLSDEEHQARRREHFRQLRERYGKDLTEKELTARYEQDEKNFDPFADLPLPPTPEELSKALFADDLGNDTDYEAESTPAEP